MGKLAKDLRAGDFSSPSFVIESILQSDDTTVIAVISSDVVREPRIEQWDPDDLTTYMSAVCPHCGQDIKYTLMNGEQE